MKLIKVPIEDIEEEKVYLFYDTWEDMWSIQQVKSNEGRTVRTEIISDMFEECDCSVKVFFIGRPDDKDKAYEVPTWMLS